MAELKKWHVHVYRVVAQKEYDAEATDFESACQVSLDKAKKLSEEEFEEADFGLIALAWEENKKEVSGHGV